MRIGLGVDVHRLVSGRPLVLGGILIPHERGLLGHSDADVAIHAVCDALLGAAGMGDIGLHFPDTDPEFKGVDSTRLLARVAGMLAEKGYALGNIDLTVIAQAPKIAPYRNAIQARIAEVLGTEKSRVNVKATTTEALGPMGRQEGISACCVALIHKAHDAAPRKGSDD